MGNRKRHLQNSNGNTVEFYSETTKLLLAPLLAGVVTAAVKWFGWHLNVKDARRIVKMTEHDQLIWAQFDLQRDEQHIDDLHHICNSMIKRFKDNKAVSEADIYVLEIELAQRPKLRNNSHVDKQIRHRSHS